mgnify:CR=1 FL=1
MKVLYLVKLIKNGWDDEHYYITNKEEAQEALKKMRDKGYTAVMKEVKQ